MTNTSKYALLFQSRPEHYFQKHEESFKGMRIWVLNGCTHHIKD